MNDNDDRKSKILANIQRALGDTAGVEVQSDGNMILAFKRRDDWQPPFVLRHNGSGVDYVPAPRPDESPAVYARRYRRFFRPRPGGQMVYEPGFMGLDMIAAGALPAEYRRAIDEGGE